MECKLGGLTIRLIECTMWIDYLWNLRLVNWIFKESKLKGLTVYQSKVNGLTMLKLVDGLFIEFEVSGLTFYGI